MDSNQSNDGSQGDFPGGNMFPYQGAWNPYMYPPLWFQQGLPPPAPNVSVMHPVTNDPEVVHDGISLVLFGLGLCLTAGPVQDSILVLV